MRVVSIAVAVVLFLVAAAAAHDQQGPAPAAPASDRIAAAATDAGLFLSPRADGGPAPVQSRADGLPPEVARRRRVQLAPA
jgi:hypothetical protein